MNLIKQIDPAFLILIINGGIWLLVRLATDDDGDPVGPTKGSAVLKAITLLVMICILIKYGWL